MVHYDDSIHPCVFTKVTWFWSTIRTRINWVHESSNYYGMVTMSSNVYFLKGPMSQNIMIGILFQRHAMRSISINYFHKHCTYGVLYVLQSLCMVCFYLQFVCGFIQVSSHHASCLVCRCWHHFLFTPSLLMDLAIMPKILLSPLGLSFAPQMNW